MHFFGDSYGHLSITVQACGKDLYDTRQLRIVFIVGTPNCLEEYQVTGLSFIHLYFLVLCYIFFTFVLIKCSTNILNLSCLSFPFILRLMKYYKRFYLSLFLSLSPHPPLSTFTSLTFGSSCFFLIFSIFTLPYLLLLSLLFTIKEF